MIRVIVSGSFDDMRSGQVRLLQEAARLGPVQMLLWSDEAVKKFEDRAPRYPFEERRYFWEAVRHVDQVRRYDGSLGPDAIPLGACDEMGAGAGPVVWAVDESSDTAARCAWCRSQGLQYRVFTREDVQGFPEQPPDRSPSAARTRVIVTGCYDWLHSGHVRFFEEVSALGDLYVVVGHDANIRLLKGEGHPLFCQQERRYMVQAIRYVQQALISTGHGWLDAQPEIEQIRPHIYAVNEDGDRPEKRAYCEARGIEYRVLKRLPKEGLPRRQSTDLRGF